MKTAASSETRCIGRFPLGKEDFLHMVTREQYEKYRKYTLECLEHAGIALTEREKQNVEVADMGLSRLEEIGLNVITYVNTDRCCAKELVLAPWQICPEHRHPPIDQRPGKEETFRCRKGIVYLYIGTKPAPAKGPIHGRIPEDLKPYFTVFEEIVLCPGEQYTLPENTLHWFQAGADGCIVSEFSTHSADEKDVFSIPMVIREAKVI
jgi:D-lyxose ketol-isomerase